jgi:hypothetical protein
MEMINKIQRFCLIFFALIFSFTINYFLYVVLISTIINYLIVNYYTSKIIKISIIELVSVLIQILSISIFCFYGSYLFYMYIRISHNFILNFAIAIAIGLMFYLFLIYLFKPKIVEDLKSLLNKK